MDLPLLLAGPILRRVEPALVSVWVALSAPATLRLLVWEGRAATGRQDALLASLGTPTLRVGDKLHLALVTIEIPASAGKSLQPDALYSYDLEITTGDGAVHGLGSLGMLSEGFADGAARLPLGFEVGLLPSFAPPPSEIGNLNILYGSCRRPAHPDPDALAMVDELIFGEDRYKDPRARPHQLFLGGDQIYADDVAPLQMLMVMDRAMHLIGALPGVAPTAPVEGERFEPVEHIRLDKILRYKDETTVVDPLDIAAAYVPEDEAVTRADPDLPVDRAHFPEERRKSMTLRDAQFTGVDSASHVISLGEFAALYLTVWSNALWGAEIPGARFAADPARPQENRPIRWDEELPETGVILMPEVVFPKRIAGSFYVSPKVRPKRPTTEKEVEAAAKAAAKAATERQRDLRRDLAILREFRRGLPKAQRVLANVPTYMMMDDHDVTDDYFLNPMWRDRVLTKQLGQAILRNAMVAYALFQDWGNDPLAYRDRTTPKAELLSLVPQLFPAGLTKGPVQTVCERIAKLLGHDLRNIPTADGRYEPVRPPLTWHFMVDGPKHRVVAFDNRTRRSYASRSGPPGNVSIEALLDQLPLPPLPAGRKVLVVVAPLQVLGPPVLDDLIAPVTYRVFDSAPVFKDLINARLRGREEDRFEHSEFAPGSDTGTRGMIGTNPDAIEAWSFDAPTFEHLLERLEPYRRVVLLSGDVHYAAGALMSYWRGDQTEPARFAQFTSSGMKNVMPWKVSALDRSAGFAQQMVRANLGTERLGWDQPQEDMVLLPEGVSLADLAPVMRSRLESAPVLLPTWGWPDGSRLNPAAPPDWRWRLLPLLDIRPDAERPVAIRVLEVDDAAIDRNLADPETVLKGYRAIAARHQHSLVRMRNARQILFRSNVGRVRFQVHDDGRLDAIHELYTTFTDPDLPAALEPKPEPFMVQVAPLGPDPEAPLGPEPEAPPERLRQRAIEVPPQGVA